MKTFFATVVLFYCWSATDWADQSNSIGNNESPILEAISGSDSIVKGAFLLGQIKVVRKTESGSLGQSLEGVDLAIPFKVESS